VLVYKTVSLKPFREAKGLQAKGEVQKWLLSLIDDPLVKMLAKNSNLTKIQLESLLIDFLGSNIAGKILKNEEKARLRLSRAGTSRGAFNRTLRQARRNVIQSVYTILLLGYVGVFDSTSLDPYLEAAHKLRTYVEAYKHALSQKERMDENMKTIGELREELERSLEGLSSTRTLSEL